MKENIVTIARAEIGQKEKPINSNKSKYGSWFGFDGQPWCAMFVSWCYFHAGLSLPNIGFKKGFAGCQTAFHYFREKGLLVADPQPGDIVLFDWNADKRYDHTGIFVKKLDETTFLTIEGNTSVGNDSNGGQVMERKRKYSQAVFARVVK